LLRASSALSYSSRIIIDIASSFGAAAGTVTTS
jgi:hypothetical protein